MRSSIAALWGCVLTLLSSTLVAEASPTEIEGVDAKEIYEALNVPAIDETPGLAGGGNFLKSVGGLECRAHQTITTPPFPPATYRCSLQPFGSPARNDAEIYGALNVEEIPYPEAEVGYSQWGKYPANTLLCLRTVRNDGSEPTTYRCSF